MTSAPRADAGYSAGGLYRLGSGREGAVGGGTRGSVGRDCISLPSHTTVSVGKIRSPASSWAQSASIRRTCTAAPLALAMYTVGSTSHPCPASHVSSLIMSDDVASRGHTYVLSMSIPAPRRSRVPGHRHPPIRCRQAEQFRGAGQDTRPISDGMPALAADQRSTLRTAWLCLPALYYSVGQPPLGS